VVRMKIEITIHTINDRREIPVPHRITWLENLVYRYILIAPSAGFENPFYRFIVINARLENLAYRCILILHNNTGLENYRDALNSTVISSASEKSLFRVKRAMLDLSHSPSTSLRTGFEMTDSAKQSLALSRHRACNEVTPTG